ncbi:MAG: universal stress protein [Rhodospirillaceae bacterium]|jgi:nucleotide-binding universal stress UspA family protein|nr:universal stress protein [Rhodospirillaceae bacterium]MBT5240150.1 universal stress protein [Rhodospirillaceae bacterium]MBT6090384.1 universal stress protein [Rhodospirillaceae bacterium]MBT7449293.1 universal stress protein [Rhodospirillaceae bacterium]
MYMKSLYLALSGETDGEAATEAAFSLTKEFNAHLVGSDTVAETGPFLDQTGVGMMAAYYDELYQTAEKVQSHKRGRASELFETVREGQGVSLKAKPDNYGPTCYWHAHDGDPGVVARLGRLADVIVIACPGERSSYGDLRTLEQAVFDARRPVLMVPAGAQLNPSAPALIAWNGSAEAARTLINAVPLLAKSNRITLLQVGDLESGTTSITEAEAYLRLHGIGTTMKTVDSGKASITDLLSEEASAIGAGYVVMGAYTHNPWRELVLGGVTQHMIKHTQLPTLLAH